MDLGHAPAPALSVTAPPGQQGRGTVGTLPAAVVVADLNHNGILDLVIANKGSRDVSVLLGREDGTFADEMRFPTGGKGPDALLTGDFNGDGHLDLATVAFENSEVLVLLGKGDGTFHSPVPAAQENLDLVPETRPLHASRHELFPRGEERQGGVAEPTLTQPFSGGNGPHLTGAFLSHTENGLALDGGGDGQEPVVLPASLDMPAPLARSEGQRPPLADVLVVAGPGFTTEMELLSPWGEHRNGQGGSPLLRPPSDAPPEGHVFRSSAVGGGPQSANGPMDEPASSAFRMDREDLLSPNRLDAVSGRHDAAAPPLGSTDQEEQTPPPDRDAVPGPASASSRESAAGAFFCALLAFSLWLSSSQTEKEPGGRPPC
jgi:hypothetical protein